jgi:hypothetical protein
MSTCNCCWICATSTTNGWPSTGCPSCKAPATRQAFLELHKKATGQAVTEFLVFQPENPNSIFSSICQARENARMVRDQISIEFWEELNRVYLFVRSPEARKVWRQSPSEFFQQIKSASLHLVGIGYATILRNEGWWFSQVGKFLERADKTSRILDVRYQSLPERGRARKHQPDRGPGLVGHPALVQRVGRLQIHSRRGRPSALRRRVFALQRGFSALGPFLRQRVEHGLAAYFRRAQRTVLQRRGKAGRPAGGGIAIQHGGRNFRSGLALLP